MNICDNWPIISTVPTDALGDRPHFEVFGSLLFYDPEESERERE